MSEPTQYDLVQDARLDAHERLITPQDRERYGVEYSFPVVGQQVSDDEFQQMMLSTAAGILDQGGRPFWLKNFDDASRTAMLTVSTTTNDAKAAMNGFFYRLVQDMTVSLPMPSSATTYHICLTYDPLGHGRQSGPISVQVYAGEPPYRDGLLHVELWTVECKPSQLLSEAKVTPKRPRVAPQINVDGPESMPDPRSQLWGATCYIRHGEHRGAVYVATGSSEETGRPKEWERFDGWFDLGDTPTYVWAGHGERRAVQIDGTTRRLRGRLKQANGENFRPSDGGYLIYTASERNAPRQATVNVVAGWGTKNPAIGIVRCERSGEVRFYPKEETGWVDLTGVEWYVD